MSTKKLIFKLNKTTYSSPLRTVRVTFFKIRTVDKSYNLWEKLGQETVHKITIAKSKKNYYLFKFTHCNKITAFQCRKVNTYTIKIQPISL